jgi:hypothetical protein
VNDILYYAMNNKLSYAILKNTDPNKLEIQVIEYMQEGWEPIGGIVIDNNSPAKIYQTMVRK